MCQFMDTPLWSKDLFQSLAAGIMLVELQQSSDNSLCFHSACQAGITCDELQKKQVLAPNSRPKFDLKYEAILASPYETKKCLTEIEAKNASVKRKETVHSLKSEECKSLHVSSKIFFLSVAFSALARS